MFSFIESPTPFRLRQLGSDVWGNYSQQPGQFASLTSDPQFLVSSGVNSTMAAMMRNHDSHPDFLKLAGLVCEAVLEVVFVALPGFIVAASGRFDAKSQKFVAELNTNVFTPCLVFTKLASQLNADKLADLAIIPVIFIAQTTISWICAQCMARAWGFGGKMHKRQRNFILAMGVFGNSNSLPISLVLSLSKTIKGLHWDMIPGDNDEEVAARGILYLLIFQQLGQFLRWTWGYSVLLKPKAAYDAEERLEGPHDDRSIEEGAYQDEPDLVTDPTKPLDQLDSGFNSGISSNGSTVGADDEDDYPDIIPATPAQGNNVATEPATASGSPLYRCKNSVARFFRRRAQTARTFGRNVFRSLPHPVQALFSGIYTFLAGFLAAVWRQMNPPLWAMFAALVVASVPALQHLFFDEGTLVRNSVTGAIRQTGNVAVPLILVVLGANLARSTLPQDQLAVSPEEKAEERRLLGAALLSRMFLPTIIMAPLLAAAAKYLPISTIDDPIFIIVCFLLTGAPSALQLAQICQINNVFMGAMSNLLVVSYVFTIFPSTLALVMLALETLEWAKA